VSEVAGGEPAGDTTGSAPGRLEVGHIARAHGLAGQVVVELVTNRTERVAPGSVLSDPAGRSFEVVSSAPHGAVGGRDRWVVTFAGVATREDAETLRGTVLSGDPLDDPDALWVHELIGATLVDLDGAPLGTVVSVQSNPASDLLVTATGALVPLRFVRAHEPGRLTIDAPPGLFELP
jgi:16S rRNA processing protein RimM